MYFSVMATIQEIYNSDWPTGLAAAAYLMIQSQDPQILDKHEPVPELQDAQNIGVKVKELNSDLRMIENLNLLITEIAVAYVVERTTSRTNLGGPYTLFGHASSETINLGFIALICSSIDDFNAFTIFKDYNSLDKKIIKAFNTMKMDSAPAYMEARRLKWISLEEECDALREEAGI